MRLRRLYFSFALSLWTAAPGAAPAPDLPTLLQKAANAFHRDHDPQAAAALYNQAVESYPEDASARMQRALFMEQVSGMVKEEARQKYVDYSLQDLGWVAEYGKDEFLQGTARDSIRRLRGKVLFPTKGVECSKEAREAYDRAEAAYMGGRFREALPDYTIAAGGCPESANIWLSWADTHVHLGEDTRAKELFDKAVAADPWNSHARRMLSRVEIRLGDPEAAFRSGAWAVIADPESEASWSALRSLAEQTSRAWHRVYDQKPQVGAGEKPGDTSILFPMIGGDDSKLSEEEKKGLTREERRQAKKEKKAKEEAESAATVPWMTYSFSKALAISEAKKSPVEIEREAISAALQSSKEAGSSGAPFWAMLHRAKDAGFLEEAIFIHLVDAQLADPYRRYREAHADRLLAYLTNVLAPKLEPPERPGPPDAKS